MYAFAESTRSRTVRQRLAGLHVARARGRAAISSSSRGSRSSPVTTPMRTLSATPRCRATLDAPRAAQAGGFTPPALAMTRTPRSAMRRQHALDRADEVARVAHRRVALLLLLQNATS